MQVASRSRRLQQQVSLLRKEYKTHAMDYEDYEDISFPDFDEFTRQFEKEEEEGGKGKSDPDIHQKTKAKSDPNIDCIPHPHPHPFSSNSYSCPHPPAPISPLALQLHDPLKSFKGPKWIPETELCEQEQNEFSLHGQTLLKRYNEIKGTNFEFVRLLKIQLMPSSGITCFIEFEAKPSGTERTLKIFEGSMSKDYVYSHRLWPMSC